MRTNKLYLRLASRVVYISLLGYFSNCKNHYYWKLYLQKQRQLWVFGHQPTNSSILSRLKVPVSKYMILSIETDEISEKYALNLQNETLLMQPSNIGCFLWEEENQKRLTKIEIMIFYFSTQSS